MVDVLVWIAVFGVITLRTAAVAGEHSRWGKTAFGSWFRFYQKGFRYTLGAVGVLLAVSAYLHGSEAWMYGNAVFAFAAFIDFRNVRHLREMAELWRWRNRNNHLSFYVGLPIALFYLSSQGVGPQDDGSMGYGWHVPFEVTGVFLLAFIFLSMKLEAWGPRSFASWWYLIGATAWDSMLFTGACIEFKIPFMVLEGYALALDSVNIYLVKFRAQEPVSDEVRERVITSIDVGNGAGREQDEEPREETCAGA